MPDGTFSEKKFTETLVGDKNTTDAEFYEAQKSGKICLMVRNLGGAPSWTWVLAYANLNTATFYSVNNSGNVMYGTLTAAGAWSYETKDFSAAVQDAANAALAQAKASGEFDGADGQPGAVGKDGTSVTVTKVTESTADGGNNVVTFSDGKTLTVKNGKTGGKGDDGNGIKSAVLNADYTLTLTFDDGTTYTTPSIRGATGATGGNGSNGKDGTSATHSWNGTTLTVTSASGTSSANLKGDKGDTGGKGADGVSPTVAVSKSGKVTTVSITDKNGTKTATINDGADGSNGKDGSNGVSVSSVKQTTTSSADGGSNVVTVTLSNGTTSTFTIKNGSKGSTGATGAAGKTPVKGTDYWTAADQESIVQDVIAALGTPVFGRVDADNNIILTGALADGTYTLKYEDSDGEQTVIGTLNHTVVPEPTYTNVIPTSIGYDGAVLNGTGYLDGYRLTSSQTAASNLSYVSAQTGYFATGFFPYTIADAQSRVPFYVKGVDLSSPDDKMRIMLFGSNTDSAYCEPCKLTDTDANGVTITKLADKYYKITPNANFANTGGTGANGWVGRNATMARFSLPGSGAGVILTVNEPIE
jgi:hypothetical protein